MQVGAEDTSFNGPLLVGAIEIFQCAVFHTLQQLLVEISQPMRFVVYGDWGNNESCGMLNSTQQKLMSLDLQLGQWIHQEFDWGGLSSSTSLFTYTTIFREREFSIELCAVVV